MAIIPIARIVSAMAMIQSVSPIEVAAKSERNWFIATVAWLIAGAFVTGLLTVLLYRKTGQYQAAVNSEARARIAEAGTKAAEANAEAAKANEGLGKSNQEIARLTAEAENAKTERAEADRQIAIAKADAAKAREGAEVARTDALRAKEGIANAEAVSAKAAVEVERLQIVVADAEVRRLEAERAFLELQERVKPRKLTDAQRKGLVELLKDAPKGPVMMECLMAETETCSFAEDIRTALIAAGFKINQTQVSGTATVIPTGVNVLIHDNSIPRHSDFLMRALRGIGLKPIGMVDPFVPEGMVFIRIGVKP